MLNLTKDCSSKNYISNGYKSHVAYVENDLYKRSDNRTFNNTNDISKNINQYTTDVVNNYKTNKVSNLKNSHYNFNDDVVIHKHNTMYTNGNTHVRPIRLLRVRVFGI